MKLRKMPASTSFESDSKLGLFVFTPDELREFAGKIWQECLASSDTTTLDVTFYDWWQKFMKQEGE